MTAPAKMMWDHSGLWGLMCWETCRLLGLPVQPVTAGELADGGLEGARLLVVPGGWPSLKRKALGGSGAEAVRRFVRGGGCYLGFCGGGGLALGDDDGLGLIPLGRSRGKGRVPSASGPVFIAPGEETHPLWRGQERGAVFHVWFPGQFGPLGRTGARPVGLYHSARPELHCADVPVGRLGPAEIAEREKAYGLRLNPAPLWGRPAIIERAYGQGRVLASYAHLDTPGDAMGNQALAGLWRFWAGIEDDVPVWAVQQAGLTTPGRRMRAEAWRVWEEGRRMGLWQARHPAMPLWRRGARGLEFWTLVRLCQFVANQSAVAPGAVDLALLGGMLEPLWAHAPAVLGVQRARLDGAPSEDSAHAVIEAQWFPAPRRTGGDLAEALAALENAALQLTRATWAIDNPAA